MLSKSCSVIQGVISTSWDHDDDEAILIKKEKRNMTNDESLKGQINIEMKMKGKLLLEFVIIDFTIPDLLS